MLEVTHARDALIDRAIEACERRASLSDAESARSRETWRRRAARGVADRQQLDAFVDAHVKMKRKQYACAFVADIARSGGDGA